jgi:CheY-like chemotaxis protein
MAPHVLKRALEPFFTTKPAGSGTGLGLSMAYAFVEQSGGAFLIESVEEVGTTISIFLPSERAVFMMPPRQERRAVLSECPIILVVDDDIGVRESVRAVTDGKYQLLEAETAAQALELLTDQTSAITFVLSDIVMPGKMNGVGLMLKLRQDHPEIRLALMSGGYHDIPPELADVVVLQKPFTSRTVLSTIENAK